MEHIDVQGVRIPALGLGTWELVGSECAPAVRAALELGYRHIDTAQVYGNETEVGEALVGSGVDRDELFLTTKVWIANLEPGALVPSVEDSLRKLRVDHLDLLLIHWPAAMERLASNVDEMRGLQEGGKTRYIGVSNFTPSQVEEALSHGPILCNQVEYHPYLSQDRLLAVAAKHDLMLTAYSPLARGGVLTDPVLGEIGERHGKSAAQVAIRWLLDQDHVAVIPKATTREHLEANFDVFDFALDNDERARIAGLDRGERIIDPPWAPDWER
jgi:2,5-diketo-D-gluconate reductase B